MAELSKTKFSLYKSLGTSKMRRKHGLFTVEGAKAVADMLGSYRPEAIICIEGYTPDFEINSGIIVSVSEESMRKLSNLSTHSPVMGVFKIPSADKQSLAAGKGLTLVLDGVQDPGNLGTIIRTCHWFGVKQIFASADTVDIYNPKTVQSTMGSLGKVRVVYCSLPELFRANSEKPVYGTMLNGDNIFNSELQTDAFLVMGNEGKGISPEVAAYVDKPLLIPPKNEDDHSESLNVAVATAIAVAMFSK